jgi:hypothetical protein
MRSDMYTKSVLTVIAAALVTLAVQQAIRSSVAATDQVQKVAICDPGDPNKCAPVIAMSVGGGQSVNSTPIAVETPLYVNVLQQPLSVVVRPPSP